MDATQIIGATGMSVEDFAKSALDMTDYSGIGPSYSLMGGFNNEGVQSLVQNIAQQLGIRNPLQSGTDEQGYAIVKPTPEFAQALQQYQFQPYKDANGLESVRLVDGSGNIVADATYGTKDNILYQAVPAAIAAMAAYGAYGALGGAGGAGGGASSGALAVEPAAGLAGGTAGASGATAAGTAGATGAAGFSMPAYGAGFVDSLGATSLANTAGTFGTAGAGLNGATLLGPGIGGAAAATGGNWLKSLIPDSVSGLAKFATPVLQGAVGQYTANKAAGQQQAATDQALGEIRRQFDLTRSDFAPYRDAGSSAIGQALSRSTQMPTAEQVMATPGYQFGLEQGQAALDRKQAAMGGRVSGNALKAASQWNSDYATGRYQQAYDNLQQQTNNLLNIAGIGSGATANTANLGQQSTNAMANLISSQGDANAAGTVGAGNGWANVIGQIGGALMTPSGMKTVPGNQLWQAARYRYG